MAEQVKKIHNNVKGGGEAVYGLGLIGAFVYFMTHAHSFWEVIFGIFQSILWPAFLVYQLLAFLKM
jgi:hypothetical protein